MIDLNQLNSTLTMSSIENKTYEKYISNETEKVEIWSYLDVNKTIMSLEDLCETGLKFKKFQIKEIRKLKTIYLENLTLLKYDEHLNSLTYIEKRYEELIQHEMKEVLKALNWNRLNYEKYDDPFYIGDVKHLEPLRSNIIISTLMYTAYFFI